MRDVLNTLDQCMTLPCEIAQFILFHLRQECCDHGCIALNQMQSLLRITGNAGSESLLKLLLLRLDEQDLAVSTPWAPQASLLIAEMLWPNIWELDTWHTRKCSRMNENDYNAKPAPGRCIAGIVAWSGIVRHFFHTLFNMVPFCCALKKLGPTHGPSRFVLCLWQQSMIEIFEG